MACPFFIPSEKMDASSCPHPVRLPLGAAWKGKCSITLTVPTDGDLSDHCNLGYSKCSHLPANRTADAIRFIIASSANGKMTVRYACERDHAPADCGTLEFDRHQSTWATQHPDPRVQKMADCFITAYLDRTRK